VDDNTTNSPECDHRQASLVFEDDYGVDWECLECGFEGHDAYV
jgi:Zn ribbon nucleic-acid-binding protein